MPQRKLGRVRGRAQFFYKPNKSYGQASSLAWASVNADSYWNIESVAGEEKLGCYQEAFYDSFFD